MKWPSVVFFLLLLVSIAGCIPQKNVVFFQKDKNTAPPDLPYLNQDYEFFIAPFDVLSLQITGLANEQGQNVAAPFSTPITAAGGGQGAYASGILVDKNGDIELLYAGKIKLAGLTLPQAADTIRAALSKYIIDTGNEVTVNLKILNYSVTLLGEVATQGILKAENEFMTVTEALAKSGGVTPFGNMKTVRVIRVNRLTKRTTTYRLDLTQETAVSPILSRLQPDDIIVVDPLRRKQFNTAGQIIGFVSTIISVPTFLISTYALVRSLTRNP